jgi:hypothetical protein
VWTNATATKQKNSLLLKLHFLIVCESRSSSSLATPTMSFAFIFSTVVSLFVCLIAAQSDSTGLFTVERAALMTVFSRLGCVGGSIASFADARQQRI